MDRSEMAVMLILVLCGVMPGCNSDSAGSGTSAAPGVAVEPCTPAALVDGGPPEGIFWAEDSTGWEPDKSTLRVSREGDAVVLSCRYSEYSTPYGFMPVEFDYEKTPGGHMLGTSRPIITTLEVVLDPATMAVRVDADTTLPRSSRSVDRIDEPIEYAIEYKVRLVAHVTAGPKPSLYALAYSRIVRSLPGEGAEAVFDSAKEATADVGAPGGAKGLGAEATMWGIPRVRICGPWAVAMTPVNATLAAELWASLFEKDACEGNDFEYREIAHGMVTRKGVK